MEAKFKVENNEITGIRITGSADIPNGVTRIGDNAFRCRALTSITIPNSVTSIGYGAFSKCFNLTRIVIPKHFTDESVRE